MRTSKILKYLAFALMTLFGVLGGLFAAGYAFEDPGGWAAIWMTLAVVLPVAVLIALALWRPVLAAPVLTVVTALVVVFNLLDKAFRWIPRDDWGPVDSVALLGLGVALGFLGLQRPRLAGWLLVISGAAQLLGIIIRPLRMGRGEVPPLGALLGGSSGVVVVPMVVIGVLFLLAGLRGDEPKLRAAHAAPAH